MITRSLFKYLIIDQCLSIVLNKWSMVLNPPPMDSEGINWELFGIDPNYDARIAGNDWLVENLIQLRTPAPRMEERYELLKEMYEYQSKPGYVNPLLKLL